MVASDKHALAGKRIIISGAGIAGLIFARTLDLNWPSTHPKPEVIIYERSTKVQPKSRDGYSIGIKIESGLRALHSVGLLQVALDNSTTRMDNELQVSPSVWNKDWKLLLQASIPKKTPEGMPDSTPLFIRLSRGKLRSILLNGSTATIHYQTKIDGARALSDGTMELKMSDGTRTTCDLLIAADGAGSRIRQSLLPDQQLDFAGVVVYLGQSEFPQGKPDPLKERWGINISGQGVPFLTFPVDETHGVWATSYRTNEPVKRISGNEAIERYDEVLANAHRITHMFKNPCRQFIDSTERDGLTVFNAMHKYPIEHAKMVPQANVVFLGDANHPMSPFSGNGANMALMDGVVLAEQLVKHITSVRDAITAFDAESMPRSKSAIDKSYWTIRILHSQGLVYWVLTAFLGLVKVLLSLTKKK